MKKLLILATFLSVAVYFAFIMEELGWQRGGSFKSHEKNEKTVNNLEKLQKLSSQLNKTLPMFIDSETRMDKTTISHNILIYNYTLVSQSYEGFKTIAEIELLKGQNNNELKNYLLDKCCNDPKMKDFIDSLRDIDSMFRAKYFDKNMKLIYTFDFNPARAILECIEHDNYLDQLEERKIN